MLSKEEKAQLVRDHWTPEKSYESLMYAVERWVGDYGSIRAGTRALAEKAEEQGVAIKSSTLFYHLKGRYKSIDYATGVSLLRTILDHG